MSASPSAFAAINGMTANEYPRKLLATSPMKIFAGCQLCPRKPRAPAAMASPIQNTNEFARYGMFDVSRTQPSPAANATPPAMPEKTMARTLKRSIRAWVVRAALTMLSPLSTSTTGLPSSIPVVNRAGPESWVVLPVVAASRAASSGAKADITATLGVGSSTAARTGEASQAR